MSSLTCPKTMHTYEKEVQDQILKTLSGGHSPLLQQGDSIDSAVGTGINSSLDYGTLENNDFSFQVLLLQSLKIYCNIHESHQRKRSHFLDSIFVSALLI